MTEEAIVRELYLGILNRVADPGGLRHYTAALQQGTVLASIIKEMLASSEFKMKTKTIHAVEKKDIFNGILDGDEQKVQAICDAGRITMKDVYTDALGVRVAPQYYPWITDRIGKRSSDVPIPNDGYFAEGIEYVALALAFEEARDQHTFTTVEIGAGWGPWVSATVLVARRLGFTQVNIAAFEADEARFKAMRSHLAVNEIIPMQAENEGKTINLRWKLVHAAADAEDRTLYWPIAEGIKDAGMAAVNEPGELDYRGKKMLYTTVQAVDIRRVLKDFSPINFLHIDIQGAEHELLNSILPFLEQQVRFVFIGTHSRKIEGDLLAELTARGWTLLRERPCQFNPSANAPSLTGLTYVDGGQLWRPVQPC